MADLIRKVPKGVELRAYIFWEKRWHHVYIISGFDQYTIIGEPVNMLEFKLTKNARTTHASEKKNFHQKRPKEYKSGGGLS